jgi:hypothetical protein
MLGAGGVRCVRRGDGAMIMYIRDRWSQLQLSEVKCLMNENKSMCEGHVSR